MIDSLSGQPEPPEEAIDAGVPALRRFGQTYLKDQAPEIVSAVLKAAVPAFLAAGWLPPNALEQVGWGEASSEWVALDPDGVETTPAISFTDDIEPRPEWAEFAIYRVVDR